LGNTPRDKIGSDDRIIEDLKLDSLDYATVLLDCERWLGIRIQEDGVDWSKIRTVSELAAFLMRQPDAAQR
jgi:acyl carrier protein